MTKIKYILLGLLLFLLISCVESGYSADVNELVSSLKQEDYSLYIMNRKKAFFEINEARTLFRKICNSIESPPIGVEQKSGWRVSPIFKVKLKNTQEIQINFCLPLWRCFLGDESKNKHSFALNRLYDTKLHVVLFKRIFYLIGEKETPPEIATWFSPKLKAFLPNYFREINRGSPVYFRRLAFFFEEIEKNKSMHGNYSFLEGKTNENLNYINELILFLTSRGNQLTFSDYAGIVYPICNKFSPAPQYIEYPTGCPEKIISLLKSFNDIKSINGGNYKGKAYNMIKSQDILREISQTLSPDLQPDQLPQTRGFLFAPKITFNIEFKNGTKCLIGFAHGKLLTHWSYFSPELKRWIYYNVTKAPNKKEFFCSLYKQ